MTIVSERGSVQNPFLRYAEETGWTYLTPEQALDLRRGLTSPVLDSVLVDQLQRLNPGVVDHLRAEAMRDRLVRVRPGIEGNLDAWEFMKGLKTVFVESERRERNVRLIDFDNLDANLYHVTDELTFSNGTPPDIRTDLNFFINGIPILLGETKSSKKTEGIAEALDDIRAYHRDGPELLATAATIAYCILGRPVRNCANQGLLLTITPKRTLNSRNAKTRGFPRENAGFLGFLASGR